MSAHAPPPSETQWRQLLEISRSLAATTNADSLLNTIAQAACTLLDCERATVFLHEPGAAELCSVVALHNEPIRIPDHRGIAGASFTHNQIVLVESAQDDPRVNREVDRLSGYTTRNLLSAPMLDIDGKPVGVLQALNRHAGTFAQHDIPLIQLLADHAGVAVQRHRLHMHALASAGLRNEMERARDLQQSMLPQSDPNVPGLQSAAWAATASLTGGDAYDLWPMPDSRLGIFLADAAGHGLPPAIIVAQVRSLIRAFCEDMPTAHPDLLLGKVNRRVAQDFQPGRFVTTFLAFAANNALYWSSAGHGPVFLRASTNAPFETLDPQHLPLGVSEDWSADPLPSPAPPLSPGAMLIAPSDGIFEAANPAGEQFGTDRLLAIITTHQHAPLPEIVSALKHAVQSWHANTTASDDQTFVIIRWT